MTQENGHKPTIAMLGTGRMGAPMARNLLAASFPVRAWNRTFEKAAALGPAGAEATTTPSAATQAADVLITMLSDGQSTEQAMLGDHGALASLAPGAIWIQMGTIGIAWTARLQSLAGEHGCAFVDAPVSGSDGPAREAKLVILAAGDEGLRPRVQPIFDAVGRRTLWLGAPGNGSALKLVLNAWLAATVEAAAECVALTEELGLQPSLFTDALADLPIGSPYGVIKAKAMIAREFEPGFALRHALKDVVLALDAVAGHELELPLLELINERWSDAVQQGHGDQDLSAAVSTLR
jgi:3-hydroxyisobutyrate dehydrogenase